MHASDGSRICSRIHLAPFCIRLGNEEHSLSSPNRYANLRNIVQLLEIYTTKNRVFFSRFNKFLELIRYFAFFHQMFQDFELVGMIDDTVEVQ